MNNHQDNHPPHPSHRCPHNHQSAEQNMHKLEYLDSRQRELLIAPETLIAQLPIEDHHTLLDAGAGTGFFTIPLAQRTNGTVYALDPDEQMLRIIETKAAEKALSNIELVKASLEEAMFQKDSIDFALASLLLHEVDSLPVALNKLSEFLKTGGHLFCLEFEKDVEVAHGPPLAIRIGSEELQGALLLSGFSVVKSIKISPSIYAVLAKNEK